VEEGSIIHTDGAAVYDQLNGEKGKRFGLRILGHEVVIHNTGQYVRESEEEVGQLVTTNRIENVWKYVKKSISGQGNSKRIKRDLYKSLYFRAYLNQVKQPSRRLSIFLKHLSNFFSMPWEEEKERNYIQYFAKVNRKVTYKL